MRTRKGVTEDGIVRANLARKLVRERKDKAMRCALLSVCILSLMAGCGLGELRERQALLQKLATTNAPLSAVEAQVGHIPIYRRDCKDWNDFRAVHSRYADPKSKRILQKIEK